ncbi:dephospho-CoA kinase [Schizosaccharomyces cryophilus OY26]|uniref:Dephospho-CoA kinase n=1 Tax=Schizosaccharomyces cryophilus (strain OY26 / ATCC MYA-4695 / CBS 11777 / NBRC 106824 / NRRL Y48691) TaxID=653667 RepID=S9WYU0_SCHCR|nr:dephospho-CoA kinase [Schizosaccharomyces cryophilus OY26]EPY49847.1 dephospho-CoA kinase [Schizosaccharomyces cryophilus OY26]
MLIIGLTGSIATGKTTVSKQFHEKYHVPVIDADILARKAVEPGTKCLRQIRKEFGQQVILPDGTLNRPELGKIIFETPSKRKLLNSIVHPAVRKAMLKDILYYYITGHGMVILDIPLLFEAKMHTICWKTICVASTTEIQKQRLLKRNPEYSSEDADRRIQSQTPIQDKETLADFVIDNNSDFNSLSQNIHATFVKMQPSSMWTLSCLIIPALQLLMQFYYYYRQMQKATNQKKIHLTQ